MASPWNIMTNEKPSFLPRIQYGINSNRNPERPTYWIPGQARNDNQSKETYDALY